MSVHVFRNPTVCDLRVTKLTFDNQEWMFYLIIFGYKTCLYDGNFYTGYQAWKQNEEFKQYSFADFTEMPIHFNGTVKNAITEDTYILTSGYERIWSFIAKRLRLDFFYDTQMSAETKFFITKHIQGAGKRVIAYGDGMDDYFMLKQADEGYLAAKPDGTISRSLKGRNTEGLVGPDTTMRLFNQL